MFLFGISKNRKARFLLDFLFSNHFLGGNCKYILSHASYETCAVVRSTYQICRSFQHRLAVPEKRRRFRKSGEATFRKDRFFLFVFDWMADSMRSQLPNLFNTCQAYFRFLSEISERPFGEL